MKTYLNEQGRYETDENDEYIMPEEFSAYAFVAFKDEDPWGGDDEVTMVTICPIEYFERFGYMFDGYMPIEEKLSNKFSQCMEAMYEFDGTVEEANAELIAIGFAEHERFTEFMTARNCV